MDRRVVDEWVLVTKEPVAADERSSGGIVSVLYQDNGRLWPREMGNVPCILVESEKGKKI